MRAVHIDHVRSDSWSIGLDPRITMGQTVFNPFRLQIERNGHRRRGGEEGGGIEIEERYTCQQEVPSVDTVCGRVCMYEVRACRQISHT